MIYPWQQQNWQLLQQAVKNQRLAHALLLHGSIGTGKKIFAESLLAGLLCSESDDGVACGGCRSCKLLRANTHPDFHALEASDDKTIAVKSLRLWQEKLYYTAQVADKKIALIAPAEKMTLNAANSLLKTLEEPTEDSYIILISHASDKLLPTIRSRCQSIYFPLPAELDALAWLASMKVKHDVRKLLSMASGSPLLAYDYDREEAVLLYENVMQDIVELEGGKAHPLSLSLKWSKLNYAEILRWLQLYLSANSINRKDFELYDKLTQARSLLTSSVNVRLLLDDLLLTWQQIKV